MEHVAEGHDTSAHERRGVTAAFSTLGDVLDRWRADRPDDVALITEHGTLTVATFADLVDRQIGSLTARTPPGARIGVHTANSPEAAALLYAVPAAGRTLVPLNTRLTDPEKADQLTRADIRLLVGEPVVGFDGPTITPTDLGSGIGSGIDNGAGGEVGDGSGGQTGARGPVGPGDVAWIIFTSGSTGRPKGVLVTHASLAAAVATTAAARPLADDEVYLYPFPLFHVAAYNVLHAHVRRRPVVLPDRFDARRIIELCHTHEVTALSFAATMLRMVLDVLATDPDLTPPPSLRTIAYGAAPMPEPLLRAAHDVLGCAFAQGYGSTELSGNAVFLDPDAHRRGLTGEARFLHAAGYPGPGVELAIVDGDGREAPAGERGEIVIAAAQVCAGYLDDPVATAATIRGGRLHTGDIGVLDDDGLLHIVDRAKDIVVTGGENVASREVEDVLRTHPEIVDVAVVGTPDAHWGEAVTAVVVAREADNTDARTGVRVADAEFTRVLQAHVTAQLAGYKKPRRVFVVAALPHNANGKVDKPALRAALAPMIPAAPTSTPKSSTLHG